METVHSINQLEEKALTIRKHIIDMVEASQSGHPGASLSAVEMVTALYFSVLNVDPQNPDAEVRDRFVLSKGHAVPALYAVLAEKGFFPVEELKTLRQINSRMQGHPDRVKTPGIDMSTGSLGQGFGTAIGMALGLRAKSSPARVYALLGDGELNEGEVWEAAMVAAHYKLDGLTALIDQNGKQAGGFTHHVIDLGNLSRKWEAFGWHVLEVDGHDFQQILHACDQARHHKGQPTVIIAKTVKGKGVSFMEKGNEFYGEKLTAEDILRAKEELAG